MPVGNLERYSAPTPPFEGSTLMGHASTCSMSSLRKQNECCYSYPGFKKDILVEFRDVQAHRGSWGFRIGVQLSKRHDEFGIRILERRESICVDVRRCDRARGGGKQKVEKTRLLISY